MERRQLLQFIAAATGCAFAEGCMGASPAAPTFDAHDIAFFDEVAETIIPRTDTPGAKDARVGAYIAAYSEACYAPAELAALRAGVGALNAEMKERFGADFRSASPEQRTAALVDIDRKARQQASASGAQSGPPHYFTLMKQLTLYGFFTSEPGATKVARYRPIPGKYKGVVDYKPGETFWAWA